MIAGTVKDNPEESLKLFKSFVYITHMQQARCYETAINYWRRLRSQPAGLTMGVLYWQLNDIAEYASWSSYDYGGTIRRFRKCWHVICQSCVMLYETSVVAPLLDMLWCYCQQVHKESSAHMVAAK